MGGGGLDKGVKSAMVAMARGGQMAVLLGRVGPEVDFEDREVRRLAKRWRGSWGEAGAPADLPSD